VTEARGGQDRSAGQITAGRVGRPHGLDGSFYVTRPLLELLQPGHDFTVSGVLRRLERRAGTDERPIVRLAGCSGREQAEKLRGQELQVDRAAAPDLGEGAWWAHELEGCEVFSGPVRVGTVARLVELPSCDVVEVQRPQGTVLLVPLVADAVLEVDVDRRRLEIDLDFLGDA